MNNIIQLPTSALNAKLAVCDKSSAKDLIDLFIFAHENKLSRSAILDTFASEKPLKSEASIEGLQNFLLWTRRHNFLLERNGEKLARWQLIYEHRCRNLNEAPHQASSVPEGSSQFSIISKSLLDIFEEHRDEERRYDNFIKETAETHRYGFFPAGWQVDTAEWSECFKEDDPCLTIAFYLRSLFAGECDQHIQRAEFELGDEDKKIISIVINHYSTVLHRKSSLSTYGVYKIRKILKSACPAWLWDGVLDSFTKEFTEIILASPAVIVECLIEYWVMCDFDDPKFAEQLDDEILYDQLYMLYGIIAKNLIVRGCTPNKKYDLEPTYTRDEIDKLPQLSALTAKQLIDIKSFICSQLSPNQLDSEKALSELIYNSRDSIFGGSYPYAMDDLYFLFGDFMGDNEFWLAPFAGYLKDDYRPNDDPYLCFQSFHGAAEDDFTEQKNTNASKRFDVFVAAHASMMNSGLTELAIAWWSFFIASQAMGYPNLGLSPEQMLLFDDITSRYVENASIQKSLQLASRWLNPSIKPLNHRVVAFSLKSTLNRLPKTNASIVSLPPSRPQLEEFIGNKVGVDVWTKLSANSRQDLVDAESLWDRAHHEFGAGRHDWGAMVVLYSRVIESELRDNLAETFDVLIQAGIELRERTLGGCLNAIREFNRRWRRQEISEIDERVSARVVKIHKFFTEQAPFVTQHRNRATHANRDEPVSYEDFFRWRNAILSKNLLSIILDDEKA